MTSSSGRILPAKNEAKSVIHSFHPASASRTIHALHEAQPNITYKTIHTRTTQLQPLRPIRTIPRLKTLPAPPLIDESQITRRASIRLLAQGCAVESTTAESPTLLVERELD